MTDRVDDPEFDDPPGEQAKRPVRGARRRLPEPQRDHLGLFVAIQQLRHGCSGPLFAGQGEVKAFQDAPAPYALNCTDATPAGLGDLAIGLAVGTVRAGVQQNPGATGLLAGTAELAHGVLADLAFLGRELDDVLLGVGIPPRLKPTS